MDRNQRILNSLPPVSLMDPDAEVSAELAAAAAEIEARHRAELAAAKRAGDLLYEALYDHVELTTCDRISDDTLGLVLADGTRIIVTAEANS